MTIEAIETSLSDKIYNIVIISTNGYNFIDGGDKEPTVLEC
jgi:hypothetical protein